MIFFHFNLFYSHKSYVSKKSISQFQRFMPTFPNLLIFQRPKPKSFFFFFLASEATKNNVYLFLRAPNYGGPDIFNDSR